MTLKKVTREEALNELEELYNEMTNWQVYLDSLAFDYIHAKDCGAPEDILDELDMGIKEGLLKLYEIKDAYAAQYKYCHKRGWV